MMRTIACIGGTALASLVLVLCACVGAQGATSSYTYTCVGACNSPVHTETVGGAVLMGGSTEVELAFRWLLSRSGGGDVLVLRASGGDGYNEWLYNLGPAINSASTIVFHDRAASEDAVVRALIANAEAVWFAGGDQGRYLELWNGTSVASLLQERIVAGVPMGGTSAGLAIQGQFVYTGQEGSVTSAEALANPYNKWMEKLAGAFVALPWMERIVTDTHFYERDRMGRTLAFVARLVEDGRIAGGPPARAVAVDESTSVLLEPGSGTGYVVSRVRRSRAESAASGGCAYFVQLDAKPEVCRAGVALTAGPYVVTRACDGDAFDMRRWIPLPAGDEDEARLQTYNITVVEGTLHSTQVGGSVY